MLPKGPQQGRAEQKNLLGCSLREAEQGQGGKVTTFLGAGGDSYIFSEVFPFSRVLAKEETSWAGEEADSSARMFP